LGIIVAIPKGILNKIRKISCRYLWAGQGGMKGTHLEKWSSITAPKELGGWGLKDIHAFTQDLVGKILWRMIPGTSLWCKVLHSKYFPGKLVVDWIREMQKYQKRIDSMERFCTGFPFGRKLGGMEDREW
jgi:hypothetical protein